MICYDAVSRDLVCIPGAHVVDPSYSCLLVSPLGSLGSVSAVLTDEINVLAVTGDGLRFISAHNALNLLHNFFLSSSDFTHSGHIPHLLSPADKYDTSLKSIVRSIYNINYS